jgi:hypothetical protein
MSVDQRKSALKKVYWTERDSIGLAMVSDSDLSADYVSVNEVKTVTIHAVKKDENFVATTGTGSGGIRMGESPSIPEEFHDALADYAIAKGYEAKPQLLNNAVYFKNNFREAINEAKKYANKGRDGSGYHIRQYDY